MSVAERPLIAGLGRPILVAGVVGREGEGGAPAAPGPAPAEGPRA